MTPPAHRPSREGPPTDPSQIASSPTDPTMGSVPDASPTLPVPAAEPTIPAMAAAEPTVPVLRPADPTIPAMRPAEPTVPAAEPPTVQVMSAAEVTDPTDPTGASLTSDTVPTGPVREGAGSPSVVVSRATRASRLAAGAAPVVVVGLAALPYLVAPSITRTLVGLFAFVVMASMWNLLAGYGGMISVGQQGFIGVGAYTVLAVDIAGVSPFLALPVAVVVAALLALPTTALVFRLSGGYFAIGTWVVAEVYRLVTVQIPAVGGGSGASLRGLTALAPVLRGAIVYWCALGGAVLAVVVVYAIMRSRFGLALTAIRDDPTAADSLGVRVTFAKRLVFVVAAGGCGLAGAIIVLDSLRVQPDSIYSVQWSAFMIFMVVIGGIGTIEGAVLGAIVFFVLQQVLEPYGVWYLVALGAVAVAAALYARRGLWGLVARRGVRLLPTGYRVTASSRDSGG